MPPYDEFTVFGMPSAFGLTETITTRDCLTRDDVDRPIAPRQEILVRPPKKLVREIEELEHMLRPAGYQPISPRYDKIRPQTANLLARPRISPRSTIGAPSPRRPPSGARRPLSSVSAYRRAGIEPRSNALLPSTQQSIEQWRSLPKYEEAMLLGHLKAQNDFMQRSKPPLWKLSRYEFVQPRL